MKINLDGFKIYVVLHPVGKISDAGYNREKYDLLVKVGQFQERFMILGEFEQTDDDEKITEKKAFLAILECYEVMSGLGDIKDYMKKFDYTDESLAQRSYSIRNTYCMYLNNLGLGEHIKSIIEYINSIKE